ncbi:major capsid protein [Prosthecobacter sp.]|uniref:major capsid protein n=1 Tax=Prosthecobacter sp. TaxID=1965333 RepID=UPI003784E680
MKNSRHLKNQSWIKLAIFAVLGLLCIPYVMSAPVESLACLGLAGSLSLLDLSKANTDDVTKPIIEQAAGQYPEMTELAAHQLGDGVLSYETLLRIGYPSAAFHDMGAGVAASKSQTKLQRFDCFPFQGRVECPRHVANNWRRGGPAGYFAFEALGIMKSALFTLAKQIWYGRGADGKGFPGLKNFTAYGSTATDPLTGRSYSLAINAGGTTANGASSCYLVVSDEQNVEIQLGSGSVFELPEPRIGDMLDANGNRVEALISVLQGYAGLQTPNLHCVRRIFNLTNESTHTMSDALLARAIKEFPTGVKPTSIWMSANQRYQLQISRTVTLFGQGSTRPDQPVLAPMPTQYDGIPIYATDAIGDTDTIESQALAEE